MLVVNGTDFTFKLCKLLVLKETFFKAKSLESIA